MKRLVQILVLLIGAPAFSQVSLAEIFTDNMVFQRNEPIQIWGKANPNHLVEVKFGTRTYRAEVGADSTWVISMQKQEANANPQSLSITSGDNSIELNNILIGDVWLLIGQSNMEFPMRGEMHFEEEIKYANNPMLRFFNPKYIGKNIYGRAFGKTQKQKLVNGELFHDKKWELSDTTSIKTMSAVGYYFGKEIAERENIPIGLINLSIGGAPLEAFIAVETLKNSNRFHEKINGNWLENDALPVWVRERGRENLGENYVRSGILGPNHAYKPGFAFTAGIAPILKMPIKGVLLYQGESNAQERARVQEYAALQKLLIEDYRKKWNQPNLPFYWVQLSSIDTTNYDSQFWPEFRNAQRKLLRLVENGGMAVTSDIGAKHNVHPRNKKEVGQRLSRWALNRVYNKNILVSGPLPKKAVYKNGSVVVSFNCTGAGLFTSKKEELIGFSIDGKHKVPAEIKGDKVVIEVNEQPKYIYYGWKPYSNANLVNSENLPASTFKIKVE